MKKIFFSIIIITIIFSNFNQTIVYAASSKNTWVKDAFTASNKFLKENPKEVFGFENDLFKIFKNIIKAINLVLIVLLFAISAIALSVIGIKFIASGDAPHKRKEAEDNLHTAIIGMAYGFGAYTIWVIAMQIVTMLIEGIAKGAS